MGGDAKSLVTLPDITAMSQRIHLDIKEMRAVGTDWRVIARPCLRAVRV